MEFFDGTNRGPQHIRGRESSPPSIPHFADVMGKTKLAIISFGIRRLAYSAWMSSTFLYKRCYGFSFFSTCKVVLPMYQNFLDIDVTMKPTLTRYQLNDFSVILINSLYTYGLSFDLINRKDWSRACSDSRRKAVGWAFCTEKDL